MVRLLDLGPLQAKPTASLCPPRKKLLLRITSSKAGSPQRKLYTAPPTSLTLSLSQSVRQRLGYITQHTNTQAHTHTYMVAEGPLQQALIKSCSWALLLLSPCDWCLASLAVTNTDWSQTLNDFGPNLFKDSSLLRPHQTCVQLANIWAQSVTAEHGEFGNWSDGWVRRSVGV